MNRIGSTKAHYLVQYRYINKLLTRLLNFKRYRYLVRYDGVSEYVFYKIIKFYTYLVNFDP